MYHGDQFTLAQFQNVLTHLKIRVCPKIAEIPTKSWFVMVVHYLMSPERVVSRNFKALVLRNGGRNGRVRLGRRQELKLFLDGDLSDLRLWDSSNQVGRAPRIIWEKYYLRLYYGQMDTNGMIETEWNGYKLYKWKLHEIFPPFRDATAGQFLRWPRAERSGFTCGIQVDGCIFHPWNRQLNGKMRINERI